MKDIDLRVLENAEDDIIEELVPFSPDEEQVMNRVLAMSEKKYKDLIRHQEKEIEQDERKEKIKNSETVVEGVEVYHRPAWYRPLCAAAAVLLIAGGLGTGIMLNRSSRVSPETQPGLTGTTEVASQPDTEPTTVEQAVLPSQDEMHDIFEELLPVFFETWSLNIIDFTNYDGDEIYFSYERGDELFTENFYEMNDPRFSTYEELCSYYSKYLISPSDYFTYGGEVSGLELGEIINESSFVENNGVLYSRAVNKTPFTVEEWEQDVLSDKAFFVHEGSFIWERIVREEVDGQVIFAEALTIEFKKDPEDNSWKIAGGEIGGTEYEEGRDYSEGEYPLITGGPGFRTDDDIDFDSALASLEEYFDKYNDSYYNYDVHWDMITELPESYYHVTDDFRKNDRWIRFVLEPYPGADGDTRVLLVDGYGVVFGEEY